MPYTTLNNTENSENSPRPPKNLAEMYRWLFFDPELLRDFDRTQTLAQRLKNWAWFWQPMLRTIPITILLWLVCSAVAVAIMLPNMLTPALRETWTDYYWTNYLLWLQHTALGLALSLTVGLVLGLALGLTLGLVLGFALSLTLSLVGGLLKSWVSGLALSLTLGLPVDLVVGLAGGLALSLTVGLLRGLVRGLVVGLAGGLVLGLTGGLALGLAGGLAGGLAFITSWVVFYYRVPFLLFYNLRHLLKPYSVSNNPYLSDALIWLPVYGLNTPLTQYAYNAPDEVSQFIDFLLIRRPYQETLALQMQHAQTAALWKQKRLQWEALANLPPIIPEYKPKGWESKLEERINPNYNPIEYNPSEAWRAAVEHLKDAVANFRRENALHIRQEYLQKIELALDKLYTQNLVESPKWNTWYRQSLDTWKTALAQEKDNLALSLQNEQPLGPNIYRTGIKLSQDTDRSVFFGRDELRQRLKNRILNAQQMPLFMVSGQRRTGKSSLIAFLSDYLDTGFIVVEYDMQSSPPTIVAFLQTLLHSLEKNLKQVPSPNLDATKTWSELWQVFRERVSQYVANTRKRIIIAIDEYEELHRLLAKDPEQAHYLLGAMRAYMQAQNEVVFLFAGADFMTELKDPNWNEYFVQKEVLKVDYLSPEDTNNLIDAYKKHKSTEPALQYTPEARQQLYALTQGHPAMLQIILSGIVDDANYRGNTQIALEQVQESINKNILKQDDNVISIFWTQFCEDRALRPTIFALLAGTPPNNERDLFQLAEHEFIVQSPEGYRFRVPLFEQWLRKFARLVD